MDATRTFEVGQGSFGMITIHSNTFACTVWLFCLQLPDGWRVAQFVHVSENTLLCDPFFRRIKRGSEPSSQARRLPREVSIWSPCAAVLMDGNAQ